MTNMIQKAAMCDIVERLQIIEIYAEFLRFKVSSAKNGTDDPMLMLILEGLRPEIGFEVLGHFVDNEEGRSACDLTAKAVTLALIHTSAEIR